MDNFNYAIYYQEVKILTTKSGLLTLFLKITNTYDKNTYIIVQAINTRLKHEFNLRSQTIRHYIKGYRKCHKTTAS